RGVSGSTRRTGRIGAAGLPNSVVGGVQDRRAWRGGDARSARAAAGRALRTLSHLAGATLGAGSGLRRRRRRALRLTALALTALALTALALTALAGLRRARIDDVDEGVVARELDRRFRHRQGHPVAAF